MEQRDVMRDHVDETVTVCCPEIVCRSESVDVAQTSVQWANRWSSQPTSDNSHFLTEGNAMQLWRQKKKTLKEQGKLNAMTMYVLSYKHHFLQFQMNCVCYAQSSQPPHWSNGQSPWLQTQRSEFDSRLYQTFREVVGLELGPLSLVSTIEEQLGRKSSGFGIESREYGRRGSAALTTLHPFIRKRWH
jgi:hypothetical protein